MHYAKRIDNPVDKRHNLSLDLWLKYEKEGKEMARVPWASVRGVSYML